MGDFWLAGRLGAGGQGVVYEAYDAEGTRVAIKVLHGDAASDPDLRSRFGREASAAQRVASFCTARVLAVDLDAPKPYIVSEYVEGPSLRRAVMDGRPFMGDDLHRLATAVATALTAIHVTAFSPAGDLVAVTLIDARNHFRLLRLPGGEPVARRWHDSETCARNAVAVAFSPDGHTLACGTTSGISLVDVRTGRSLPNQPGVGWDSNGGRIRFSSDGRFMLAEGATNVRLIRVADGDTLLTYPGAPEDAGFDGTTLRFLTDNMVVDVDISDLVDPVRLPGPAPDTAVFSPDGRLLVTHGENSRSLVLWDVARHRTFGSPIRLSSGDSLDPQPTFSGDGRLLASVDGSNEGAVSVWDTQKGTRVASIKLTGDWYPHSLAMNADGSLLAVGASTATGDDQEGRGRLLLWDLRRGRWSGSIDLHNDVAVVFRPGTTMAAEVEGPSNRLLDLSTGRESGPALGPERLRDPLVTLAFSPDGNTVAIDSVAGLSFWDVRTGWRRGPNVRSDGVSHIFFSPKGDVTASVDTGSNVQLWDVVTPRKLGSPFRGGDADLRSAAFDSGGSVLHTIDAEGVLRDIPVAPSRVAAAVCARAGRTLTDAEWQNYLPGVPYSDPCP
ncbi:protein kinase family protein [Sphaerisporangium viridialbum]|uniref:protein kinase family protein n=1 Tax=Sphaerisporangium viridialbum TaxID=46189 RepID=UPI003C748A53